MNHRVYLTGDLTRLVGICEDTVRRWCAMGLLRPMRDSAKRRVFSPSDLETAIRLARRTTPHLRDALTAKPPQPVDQIPRHVATYLSGGDR